ncbi:MAG: hypothetical protein ACE5GY_05985 [Thermodesulfobacteriota bacterium]
MNKTMKIFAAFFAGNLVFAFLYSGVFWVVSRLDVTPYGRLMTTFFKGRTPQEAQAYIEAHQALFDRMLPEAARFSNLFVTPSVGFVMGLVMGLIISTKEWKTPVVWSFISVLPITVLFWIWSGGEPNRAAYLLFLLAATVAGGFIGNVISTSVLASRKA